MTLDEQAFELDKQRFEHEQRIASLKLELERLRLQSETRFSHRHFASIITGVVSLAAVVVSLSQVIVAYTSRQKELEVAQLQKKTELDMSAAQQIRDWNLKTAEFVVTHQDSIFGKDSEKQSRIGKVMLVTFPPNITGPLFEKLASAAESESVKSGWQSAQTAATKLLLVRTDGLYQCKGSDSDSYVRFFPDGTVMQVSVSSTGTTEGVARLLKPESDNSKGKVLMTRGKEEHTYVLEGTTVKFSTQSTEGVVEYEGTVDGDKLRLNWTSRINGATGSEEYTFVRLGS